MTKRVEVKKNEMCKHSQAKERVVEVNKIQYNQMYCPTCERVLRSERKVEKKGGDE